MTELKLLDEMYGEILQTNIEIKYNEHIKKGKFPLGTLYPHNYYRDGEVPYDHIVWFHMPRSSFADSTSFILIGKSGTGKTKLIKRLAFYFKLAGYRVGVLDLKSGNDWIMDWKQRMTNLYSGEQTEFIDFKTGCPRFATLFLDSGLAKKLGETNITMEEFGDIDYLTALGFSPRAVLYMAQLLKTVKSVDELMKIVEKGYLGKQRMNHHAVDNILAVVNNLKSNKFLITENKLNIDGYWDEGKEWAIGFFGSRQEFLSTYVDKILIDIFRRAERLKQYAQKYGDHFREKYFIVVDDSDYAVGRELKSDKYRSVSTCINSVTKWRFQAINMCFGVQDPSMLHQKIYNDIKNYFIFSCGDVQSLSGYIHNPEVFEKVKNIDFRKDKFISQCVWVKEDGKSHVAFYPFNSPLPHSFT